MLKFKSNNGGDESFARAINNFLKVGYKINTVHLVDAPFGEIYATYTDWCDTLLHEHGPIIRLDIDTDNNIMYIYTC